MNEMIKRAIFLAVLTASCFLPANAQNADFATPNSDGGIMSDPGDLGGWSSPTGPQNKGLNLPPTTTASIALKQQNLTALPDTRYGRLVNPGGENVFGDEGALLPPKSNFTRENYLENSFTNSPGMGTGRRIYSPSPNDY